MIEILCALGVVAIIFVVFALMAVALIRWFPTRGRVGRITKDLQERATVRKDNQRMSWLELYIVPVGFSWGVTHLYLVDDSLCLRLHSMVFQVRLEATAKTHPEGALDPPYSTAFLEGTLRSWTFTDDRLVLRFDTGMRRHIVTLKGGSPELTAIHRALPHQLAIT